MQSKIQRLKLLELNMLCANGIHYPKSSQMASWSALSTNGLHQLMDSHANDLISSHQLQAQQRTPQLQLEQPHIKLLMTSLWVTVAAMEVLIILIFRHLISESILHN
jgi:hypothetical protein